MSFRKLLTFATVIITMFICIWRLAQAESPDGKLPPDIFIVRIYYENIADLEQLADLDVHEFNNVAERYVLVSADSAIYYQLKQAGWQVIVDEQATAEFKQNHFPFYGGYRTVDELQAELQTIEATYPNLTELFDYGDSYCQSQGGCTTLGGEMQLGYDLMALRITNESIAGSSTISGTTIISGTKPIFFLMANIHAREITTPELAMRMIDWLLLNYGTNADATWMVDWHEIWVVPTVNPDGHWLVELGTLPPYNTNPFTQRKNANRSNGCTTWPPNGGSQYGIDLNRNHSYGWNQGGSSNNPCSLTYHGPAATSELEVSQLQALVQSLIPDQRGPNPGDTAPEDARGVFITMHSYGSLVLWPWGYTTAPAPNREGLKAIGDKLATYNGYTSCQPSLCLYIASGTSDDWAYGELGVPAFTFEIGNSFMPPYGQIDSIQWPQNGPALQYATRIARIPYRLALGPDALDVTAVSHINTMTITAVINDDNNGDNPITAAAYAIDIPYWVSSTITSTLSASDGTFDSVVEPVEAVVDASQLTNGQHMLFVRGQDNEGNWGPVSAIFFEISHGDATANLYKEVSSTSITVTEPFTYSLHYQLSLTGTHTYTTSLQDPLAPELAVLTDTIQVIGVPETAVYLPGTHEIQLNSSGTFTDAQAITITFQVSTTITAAGSSITNSFNSQETVDGLPVPPHTSNTTITYIGFSQASSVLTKTVNAAIAQPGDILTYTLAHVLTLSGTHSYTLSLVDMLPTAVTLLTSTLQLNGQPAPQLYNPISHTLHYTASSIFTNTTYLTITFQTKILTETADSTLITNTAIVTGTVNSNNIIPQSSQAITTLEVVPIVLQYQFLPMIRKE